MLCLFGFCEAISCLGFTRGRRRGEGKLSRSKERHCGGNVSSCAKRGILYRLQSTTSLHFCRKDSLNREEEHKRKAKAKATALQIWIEGSFY
ncbi:uncharacterized protein [Malus domestica]|uniref:uncharacterized protein isoform X3 n=1 Tax=Malus domestica TaxID=3750 RepID=UPI0039769552